MVLPNRGNFDGWKATLASLDSRRSEFEQWLFVRLAPVLFARKAGELLTLRNGEFGLCWDHQLEVIESILPLWEVEAEVLQQSPLSTKVVLYRESEVQRGLEEVPHSILVDALGYPQSLTPKEFIEEVRTRWNRGSIPHEIGFCLGYPSKDVIGFMELAPLRSCGQCGWQVFGDPGESFRRSDSYRNAERMALRFLHSPGQLVA